MSVSVSPREPGTLSCMHPQACPGTLQPDRMGGTYLPAWRGGRVPFGGRPPSLLRGGGHAIPAGIWENLVGCAPGLHICGGQDVQERGMWEDEEGGPACPSVPGPP